MIFSDLDKIKAYTSLYFIKAFKLSIVLTILKKIYKNIPTYSISREYREKKEPQNLDLVYGELCPCSFLYLLTLLIKKPNIKIYDLGCGDAKLLISGVLFFRNLHATGIEKIPTLKKIASDIAYSLHPKIEKNQSSLVLVEGDFLKKDFSDADIIYINGCALKKSNWEQLDTEFKNLKPGTHIISIERKIENTVFSLVYSGRHKASWGKARVYIYRKTDA